MDTADDSSPRVISFGSLIGATITVLITTLDDSIWLLPFVGTNTLSHQARLINAITFLCTLIGLAILCCLLAVAVLCTVSTTSSSVQEAEALEIRLQWIAVIFCWALAAGFYIKKQLKKRRRQRQAAEAESAALTAEEATKQQQGTSYGIVSQQQGEETQEEEEPPQTSRPLTVISLTILGFCDELSYFPALIIGHIFTVWELCLGTVFAGLIMLGIQIFVATQFKPFIDFLDQHVKLYHIIALFATILTIQLIWDITHADDDDDTQDNR